MSDNERKEFNDLKLKEEKRKGYSKKSYEKNKEKNLRELKVMRRFYRKYFGIVVSKEMVGKKLEVIV